MTNEEKALNIIFGWSDDIQGCAKDAALEMAEWKDAQFKEYLEKKREELFNSNCLSVEPYIDFINEIINELFGGE